MGVGTAASAAQAMAGLLSSPEMTSGPSQEHLDSILGRMSPVQLFELNAQMKALVQQNPAAARQLLVSQPSLTRALFQAQVLLGMVRPMQQGSQGGGAPAPPPPIAAAISQPQQQQQPIAPPIQQYQGVKQGLVWTIIISSVDAGRAYWLSVRDLVSFDLTCRIVLGTPLSVMMVISPTEPVSLSRPISDPICITISFSL